MKPQACRMSRVAGKVAGGRWQVLGVIPIEFELAMHARRRLMQKTRRIIRNEVSNGS